MKLTTTTDPSTVRDLRPNHSVELGFDRFKNSLRYHGSHVLNLRRPNRIGEFSRPYVKGDPPHLIDWKVFARSDNLLVREQRDEASATIRVVLDCGDAMNWPDSDSRAALPFPVPTKIELATRVALNLAFLHMRMGDIVRIHVHDGSVGEPHLMLRVPTASEALRIYESLSAKRFERDALIGECMDVPALRSQADICYWVSDALGRANSATAAPTSRFLKLVHVLTSLEINTEWLDGEFCYFDHFRDKKEYLGSALKLGGTYQRQIAKWQTGLREGLRQAGHGYQIVTEKTPIRVFHDELSDV